MSLTTWLGWQRSCNWLPRRRHARRCGSKSGTCGSTIRAWYGRTVKFTPLGRVYLLGAILCVALAICSRTLAYKGGPSFIASVAVAGIAYLLAIREFFSATRFPRRGV